MTARPDRRWPVLALVACASACTSSRDESTPPSPATASAVDSGAAPRAPAMPWPAFFGRSVPRPARVERDDAALALSDVEPRVVLAGQHVRLRGPGLEGLSGWSSDEVVRIDGFECFITSFDPPAPRAQVPALLAAGPKR